MRARAKTAAARRTEWEEYLSTVIFKEKSVKLDDCLKCQSK